MNAIDTNIWIYCHDRRDPVKQNKSLELIEAIGPQALPWQVGCEFIAASRKLGAHGFSQEDAWLALRDMQDMCEKVILPVPELWVQGRDLIGRYGLQYWDALLIAACLQGGIETLYSEDFSEHNQIEGLHMVNPFR